MHRARHGIEVSASLSPSSVRRFVRRRLQYAITENVTRINVRTRDVLAICAWCKRVCLRNAFIYALFRSRRIAECSSSREETDKSDGYAAAKFYSTCANEMALNDGTFNEPIYTRNVQFLRRAINHLKKTPLNRFN